jgi:hypothetical protein
MDFTFSRFLKIILFRPAAGSRQRVAGGRGSFAA